MASPIICPGLFRHLCDGSDHPYPSLLFKLECHGVFQKTEVPEGARLGAVQDGMGKRQAYAACFQLAVWAARRHCLQSPCLSRCS